ncbi:MAG: hypothetical protein KDK24_16935 [Pseudooceanicola sp.]|nr:hypothetical protein [Pseudooceanicola sp.]
MLVEHFDLNEAIALDPSEFRLVTRLCEQPGGIWTADTREHVLARNLAAALFPVTVGDLDERGRRRLRIAPDACVRVLDRW